MSQPKTLFIEDNEDILANLYDWFEAAGFSVDSAINGNAGLKLALENRFDCIVLDLMLPDIDGMEICHRLRHAGLTTPIIMLTARDALADKIAGLDMGADDYLVKPFSMKELEARMRAIMRRGKLETPKFAFGPLLLDASAHRAWRDGRELRLSPTAFTILEILMRAAPDLVSRRDLSERLWGDTPPEGSALRNHIMELRKIIDRPFPTPLLETVPHLGWRLKKTCS